MAERHQSYVPSVTGQCLKPPYVGLPKTALRHHCPEPEPVPPRGTRVWEKLWCLSENRMRPMRWSAGQERDALSVRSTQVTLLMKAAVTLHRQAADRDGVGGAEGRRYVSSNRLALHESPLILTSPHCALALSSGRQHSPAPPNSTHAKTEGLRLSQSRLISGGLAPSPAGEGP
ncbi:hypothetical protein AAFF_G00293120 [Aldrovandia affinis]|uniref:Uncharacterized protein n=1 Tax=Aldrovandia affinis TaxID=143900 RepID=A0AAD7WRS6_9TELE|nr:hypothetical protein AAFF_G00293120 [Aldrovandia affinis]